MTDPKAAKDWRPPAPTEEIANTIVSEIAEKLALMDQQLTWMDLHNAKSVPGEGMISWPAARPGTNTEDPETLRRNFLEWTDAELPLNADNVMTFLKHMKRLRYTIDRYAICDHEGDRSYYAFAAGQARQDVSETMRPIVAELQEGLNL